MNSKLRSISPLSHSKTVSFSSCKKKFSYSYLVGIKDTSGIHGCIRESWMVASTSHGATSGLR